MITRIIIGGSVVLLSLIFFGPVGLGIALVLALLFGSVGGSWTTVTEEQKEEARKMDEVMGWGQYRKKKEIAPPVTPEVVQSPEEGYQDLMKVWLKK